MLVMESVLNNPPHPLLRTRDRILGAAKELFASKGFKGTTTAEIARRAGVNEALIYRHFPAKRDLHTAILRAKLEEEVSLELFQAPESIDLPVEIVLQGVAQRFLEAHDPTFLRLYYQSALEGHELAGEFYEQFVTRFVAVLEGMFIRWMAAGLIHASNPRMSAQAFLGMLRSAALSIELFQDPDFLRPYDELAKDFTTTFINGIRVYPVHSDHNPTI
ncbi:DNA-binding transcriptional regulator, AcrR family [Terrimicrobium sacchariphilum]|uniref:DNA-binding transcriptional regulator, AcrR family n=2 Tax=Terrimicrobium sacchariphilum TaxID=690879 RepID=A0A146GDM2_TERSA|nr:DNA-binding transcriptional regulator, AcrR family [Terrimicrobium sacchariphilum]